MTMSAIANAASKRNDGSTHMDGFPVRVYRKTEMYGWQAMQPKNSQGRRVQVKASPKEGCVVLHRIQVRIRLTSQPPNDSLKEKDENSGQHRIIEDPVVNDVLVIRRRHCILISSKMRSRSLVFKFNDLKACLQFSDQLVQLNPNQAIQTAIPGVDQNYSTSSEGRASTGRHPNDLTRERDTQQILSYVARLLYDDQFVSFCNNLESNLLASEDGLEMLNNLVGHSNSASLIKSPDSELTPTLKERADTLESKL